MTDQFSLLHILLRHIVPPPLVTWSLYWWKIWVGMDFSGISVRVMYYFGPEMSTVILLILCSYHVSSQRPSASTWYLPPSTSIPFQYIILHLADLRILALFHFINNLKFSLSNYARYELKIDVQLSLLLFIYIYVNKTFVLNILMINIVPP